MGKVLKGLLGLVAFLVLAGLGYLWAAPPDLLRVGTNYAAKIVCSNTFLAGRDPQEVLEVDVQAPGHPLLRYVSVAVDPDANAVDARVFGAFAPARAVAREGLGCAVVQDAALTQADVTRGSAPAASDPWTPGPPSQDPDLAAVLSDPALLGPGVRAALVLQNGRILGETYAEGFDETTPLLGWSMTKTVTAALIGTLVQSGDLSLDAPLTASFPAWAGDARAEITLADMLSMTSGLRWNEGYGNVSDVTRMLYLTDDMAGFAASAPVEAAPGTAFVYSSGTSTMLARVWQDAVGADSLSYPYRALFGPLGLSGAVMEADASDTYVGSSYMYAPARDWARFGQFLLQDGVWNGTRLLPEGFTQRMFTPVAASDGRYTQGQMWRETPGGQPPIEDAVWLAGHDGQSVGIFPSRNLVIVRMGLTPSRLGYSPRPLAAAVIAALDG